MFLVYCQWRICLGLILGNCVFISYFILGAKEVVRGGEFLGGKGRSGCHGCDLQDMSWTCCFRLSERMKAATLLWPGAEATCMYLKGHGAVIAAQGIRWPKSLYAPQTHFGNFPCPCTYFWNYPERGRVHAQQTLPEQECPRDYKRCKDSLAKLVPHNFGALCWRPHHRMLEPEVVILLSLLFCLWPLI